MVVIRTCTSSALTTGLLLLASLLSTARSLSTSSVQNVVKTSKFLASELISFYDGYEDGQTPGLLPQSTQNTTGYSFGQSAAFMHTYIHYWHMTADETYNDAVSDGILHQIGDDDGVFTPKNQTKVTNLDQCLWALTAMSAAEFGFPSSSPATANWFDLADGVFEEQVSQWEMERKYGACGGGIREKVAKTDGANVTSTLPTACFFNLAAHLARYTNKTSYGEWADKSWDWLHNSSSSDSDALEISVYSDGECGKVDNSTSSLQHTLLAEGAAFMEYYTNGTWDWYIRADEFINSTLSTYFPGGVFTEAECDLNDCNAWSTSNGLVHQKLAVTSQILTNATDSIIPVLRTSAKAALKKCRTGKTGTKCDWSRQVGSGKGDDAMEPMGTLSAALSLLTEYVEGPSTAESGSPAAGPSNEPVDREDVVYPDISTRSSADRTSPSIFALVGLAACAFLVM
ncbi:hypothetical protein NM208_g8786 [Fusarium decemcellulare]|uniref:Uncharacterized protein n=1 Tax=Fusarium decemcellulare TaxID=57161 RepID=A0ACC1S4K9_9HYPO|nr:hypothetical protein NM208_g8786 [Fusarium decemcellulare]